VNKEIVVFNRKLHKVVKTADNVKIVETTLHRNDYMCHGMHLNISGKEKVAKQIGETITKLLSRTKDSPFILKWEEDQKDPHQKGPKDSLTADVNKEPKLMVTRPSQRHKEIQEQIGKPPLEIKTTHLSEHRTTSAVAKNGTDNLTSPKPIQLSKSDSKQPNVKLVKNDDINNRLSIYHQNIRRVK
jgi:hypothetical protein